jgi:hypothetical protein
MGETGMPRRQLLAAEPKPTLRIANFVPECRDVHELWLVEPAVR